MRLTSLSLRDLALIALIPVVVVSCDRCGPDPKPTPDDTDVSDDDPDPSSLLQVTFIDPAEVGADEAFTATVMGAGFVPGSRVAFEAIEATSVTFVDENELSVRGPALSARAYDVTVLNPDGARSVLQDGLDVRAAHTTVAACRELTVYFDLNRDGLTQQARTKLDSNLDCFRDAPGKLKIDGHADERGTTEYNQALGDRRAYTVKRYLAGAGLPERRLLTTTYGEERPAVSGHDEDAWSKNRRVELHAVE